MAHRIDNAVRDLHLDRRVPGFQYVAVNATSTLAAIAHGYAELPGDAMSLTTTMMAYSMSKTITAVAVLRLVEDGRIALDDALSRYVHWQPYGNDVRVRDLLAHTAGLPNPLPLRWVHLAEEHARFDEGAALREVLKKHGDLAARPGTRFRYSNIGYWLLGALIEQVTGQSFISYVTENVFAPLGLSTGEMAYTIADERKHATGYLERYSLINLLRPLLIDQRLIKGRVGPWVAVRPHYLSGPAFGGIVGTASAFARFLQDQLLDESRIAGRAAKMCLAEQQRTTRGVVPMTLGWHVGSLRSQRYLYKEGGGGGFHCMMRLYASQGVGTVFMSNATTVNVGRVLDRLDSQIDFLSAMRRG